jgi:ABC-type glycerol-3-phosphate transport system substrate-binding protein
MTHTKIRFFNGGNIKISRKLAGGLVLALGTLTAGYAQAAGRVTLYCSSDEAWCQQAKTEFQKATGITVDMTRKSSGETYAQIRAESANPKGDGWVLTNEPCRRGRRLIS